MTGVQTCALPILFLDEPTTGLDPASRLDLWGVIEDLVHDGTTVLLTTQYLEEADRLADNIVVIDHGRVVAEGTPKQLKQQLGDTVLELEFGSMADADRAAEVLHSTSTAGTVVRIVLTEGPTTMRATLNALDAAGIVPVHTTLREPTLDDVFLDLTGASA
mgnify:FL=1